MNYKKLTKEKKSSKIKYYTILLILIPAFAFTQDTGIKFQSGLTWNEVLSKAQKENKYIFMDCYTTWCGPCRYMTKNVFSLKEVGDFMNMHFLNVKVQMDVTKADLAEIKRWYEDSKEIEKKYSVNAYPTYLFFSPNGEIVHRIQGVVKEPEEFVKKANDALIINKQYYTVIRSYKDHAGDSTFLRQAVTAALDFQDDSNVVILGNAYIENLRTPLIKENLDIIRQVTKSSQDKGFLLLLNNTDKVDSILGKNAGGDLVRSIIFKEEIAPLFENSDSIINWDSISNKIEDKYPSQSNRVIAKAQTMYYKDRKQWPKFESAVLRYMNKYFDLLGDYETNNIAWDIFLHSTNPNALLEALKWSKRTIINYPNVGDWENVDTYANLLYKTGDNKNAILWEKNAIAIAGDADQKKEFENTLTKMLKGEKTWKE